jgi:hypothetical protein
MSDAGSQKLLAETFLSEDKMLPDRIEHGCDIIVAGDGELEQYYNYIVYHFSGVGHGLWARAYLDDIGTVTLHGFAQEGGRQLISEAAFDTPKGGEILRYLHRRYANVRLGSTGSVTMACPE